MKGTGNVDLQMVASYLLKYLLSSVDSVNEWEIEIKVARATGKAGAE